MQLAAFMQIMFEYRCALTHMVLSGNKTCKNCCVHRRKRGRVAMKLHSVNPAQPSRDSAIVSSSSLVLFTCCVR